VAGRGGAFGRRESVRKEEARLCPSGSPAELREWRLLFSSTGEQKMDYGAAFCLLPVGWMRALHSYTVQLALVCMCMCALVCDPFVSHRRRTLRVKIILISWVCAPKSRGTFCFPSTLAARSRPLALSP